MDLLLFEMGSGVFRRLWTASDFLAGQKVTKEHQRAARGMAQDERSALIFAVPLDPHYGGRMPVGWYRTSGAQNLSGYPRFLPGHRALGLQK